MFYYKRNIGDYHKKAGRLSMLEHGAYTLLLDACYDREKFPTKAEAIDWCWARTDQEVAAVEFVLSKFFILQGDIYVQSTISETIANYHENALKNKQIAIEREAARKLKKQQSVHEEARSVHEAPPNHKPITINQEPVTNKDIDKPQAASFIKPSVQQVYEYMGQIMKGSHSEAERFVDHYTANGWKVGKNSMKNWQAAVRNWTKNAGQFQQSSRGTVQIDQIANAHQEFLNGR